MRIPAYAEFRHFIALRACWTILRGGSVAYKINFTDGGGEGIGGVATYFADCQIDGKPLTPWMIEHMNPEGQAE